MRTLTAAQKGEGGGWHYVSLHRKRGGYAIGYCAEHDPHPTEREARECYAQYQRDHIRLDGSLSDWTGCVYRSSPDAEVCDRPTKMIADIEGNGFHSAALCAEHMTRENAVVALHLDCPAGDAWVS